MAGRIQIDRGEPGVAIVALIGEHELYSAAHVEQELERAIDDGLDVVVDLTRAEFLDSSVVSILLRARGEAHAGGVRFAVVMDDSTGWPVRSLFEITGLSAIFPIVSSRSEAFAR